MSGEKPGDIPEKEYEFCPMCGQRLHGKADETGEGKEDFTVSMSMTEKEVSIVIRMS